MIYLYEEAIIEDLRYQLGDSRVSIIPPDTVFDTIADISGSDKIVLPLISLKRLGFSLNEPNHNNPESLDGYKYSELGDDGKINYYQVQRIPISCRWQIDIISRTRLDNDNLVRELIFYYTNNPTLRVKIPYGLDKEHKFSINISQDFDDNSDIESHVNRGEYFRTTYVIECFDANLWKVTRDIPKSVDIEFSSYKYDKTISLEVEDNTNIKYKGE